MPPLTSTFALPPLVNDLIIRHQESVAIALALFRSHLASHPALQPAVDQLGGVDELYALRFVLSAVARKETDVAGEAGANLIDTITWRLRNLELFREITSDDEHDAASYASEFQSSYACDLGMCPAFISRVALIDVRALVERFSKEELINKTVRYHEVIRKALDRRTRATGRLIRMVSLLDVQGLSLAHINLTLLKVLGQNSKLNETYQPQLVGVAIILKPGILFKTFYSLFYFFISKSTLEKITMCTGTGRLGMSVDNCPWVSQFSNSKGLPKSYGGVSNW